MQRLKREDVENAIKQVDAREFKPVIQIELNLEYGVMIARTFTNERFYRVYFKESVSPQTSMYVKNKFVYSDDYSIETRAFDNEQVIFCHSFTKDKEELPSAISHRLTLYLIDMMSKMKKK